MDLRGEFNPAPKPQKKEKKASRGLQAKKPLQAKKKLESKSTLRAKPKFVEKIPKPVKKSKPKTKKELKVLRDGLKVPHKKVRSEFSDKEKRKIDEAFGGAHCAECGNPYIHYHHAKFRSGSGRGVWRNGVPLCETHHSLCHSSRVYADKWRMFLELLYGEFYYMDEWDLWLMNYIEAPTRKLLEAFMLDQK